MASKKKKTAKKKTAAKKTAKKKKTATKKKAAPAAKKKKKAAATTTKKKPAKKAAKKAAKKPATKAAKKPAKKAAKKKNKAAAADATRTATLVQHVHLEATPAQVYQYLTDPTLHGTFTGTVVTGEPIEGGLFTASSGYIHGTFEKLEENKLIVLSWSTTEWPKGAPPSRVELALEDAGDGTELTLTHSEVPLSQAENYRQGWIDWYWNPLRALFAAGKA